MSFIMINGSYAVQPPLHHKILVGHIGSSRLQRVKKTFLSRNLDQNMHKKALYFAKIAAALVALPFVSGGWGLCPQAPKLLFPLNLQFIFECSADLSASLKLRPIISYLE